MNQYQQQQQQQPYAVAHIDDLCIVTVQTDLDILNADAVEAEVRPFAQAGDLILRLDACEFLDSSGIRSIIRLARTCAAWLGIVAPPKQQVRRVLDITGIGNAIPIFDDLDAALRARPVGPELRA